MLEFNWIIKDYRLRTGEGLVWFALVQSRFAIDRAARLVACTYIKHTFTLQKCPLC